MPAYATLADVYNLGVPAGAVSAVAVATQQAALDAANAEADSYLSGRFKLPITVWGMDIRLHVCARAAYTMLVVRGYNPDDGSDKNVLDRATQALTWLKAISAGDITPNVTDSSVVGGGDSGGAFATQVTVSTSASQNGTTLSLGSGSPSAVTTTNAGFLSVGSPALRGW